MIGNLDLLRPSTRLAADKLMWASRNGRKATLNIACPYTSRHEIQSAADTISAAVKAGEISADDVSEELVSQVMFTMDDPDLDLMIRTSGEVRLSDFMLWQVQKNLTLASKNCSIHFLSVLWPEFSFWDMVPVLMSYQYRQRNTQVQKTPSLTPNAERFLTRIREEREDVYREDPPLRS